MDAVVQVYFHSRSPKYNCIECWGPLKDASQVPPLPLLCIWSNLIIFVFIHLSFFFSFTHTYQKGDQIRGLLGANEQDSVERQKLQSPKSFFQALFTFLFWIGSICTENEAIIVVKTSGSPLLPNLSWQYPNSWAPLVLDEILG